MKASITGRQIKEISHVCYQEWSNGEITIVKNRFTQDLGPFMKVLLREDIRVAILDVQGKVKVVNQCLLQFIKEVYL
jgi:hypothetical protein